MDYRLSKIKQTLSQRYKSNDRKATSMEESRQLRAIKKREEQKNFREQSIAKFRAAACTTPLFKTKEKSVPSSSTKKFTKGELQVLGRIRYNEMLKWKEERKKKLEKEKNSRKPVFKSGVYKPDEAKYLSDSDTEKSDRTTPFKFSQTLRDSSKKATPSVPKVTLGIKKVLVFHTGVTPQAESSLSITRPIKKRSQRTFRPPPELGVSPFPDTPGTKRPLLRRVDSFAPKTFHFKAPKDIQGYNLKQDSSILKSLSNLSLMLGEKDRFKQGGMTGTIEIKPTLKGQRCKIDKDEETKENDHSHTDTSRDIDNNDKRLRELVLDKDENIMDVSQKQIGSVLSEGREDNEILNGLGDASELNEDAGNNSEEQEDMLFYKGDKILKPKEYLEKGNADNMMEPGELGIEEDEVDYIMKLGSSDDIDSDAGCENVTDDTSKGFASVKDDIHNVVRSRGSEDILQTIKFDVEREVAEDVNLSREEIGDNTSIGNGLNDEGTVSSTLGITDNGANKLNEEMDYNLMFDSSVNDEAGLLFVDDCRSVSRLSVKKRARSQVCTPPLSKLRPRTPCSRSTRRSKLAHCNSEHIHPPTAKTPKSTKKRGRPKSLATHRENVKQTEMGYTDPQEKLITDESIGLEDRKGEEKDGHTHLHVGIQDRRAVQITTPLTSDSRRTSASSEDLSVKRLRQLVASPWITRSRGSGSSKTKKRRSVFGTNRESPALVMSTNSPAGNQGASPSFKENQNKLLELLTHSERAPESPESCVWGPDSPQIPLELSEDAKLESEVEENKHPVQQIPALKTGKRGRRSSKKVSLLLPTDEDHRTSSMKYPVTPVRKASRASTGQRVSLLPGLGTHMEDGEAPSVIVGEHENLISLESPAEEGHEIKKRAKRGRKSRQSSVNDRVSLLPGLHSYPEEGDYVSAPAIGENTDLISWESPSVCQTPGTIKKRKSRKSTNINTPLRRSTRGSQI